MIFCALKKPVNADSRPKMFAVPGWAVSADLLQAAAPKNNSSKEAEGAAVQADSKSRKRKRDEPKALLELKVTSEDLQRSWNKEFGDGSSLKTKPPKRNKKNKQRQSETEGSAAQLEVRTRHNVATVDESTSNSKDNPRKRKRKQKREDASVQSSHAQRSLEKAERDREINGSAASDDPPKNDKEVETTTLKSSKKAIQHTLEKLQALPAPTVTTLTPLQVKMRDKLTSARFRHLNETLYTSPSSASLELFSASPDLFAEYHAGFSQQVRESWPENPVNGYIRDISGRAKVEFKMRKQEPHANALPLPRRKTGSCTIADLGCGDAPLARAFQSKLKELSLKFHNFDLHMANTLVTKADITNLPLRDGEADVAIFCLSLMGTNWISFIEEAWRILRGDGKGELWVAEVKSRFGRVTRRKIVENSVGKKRKPQKSMSKFQSGTEAVDDDQEMFAEAEDSEAQDETDVSAFVEVVQRRGFVLQPQSVSKRNKMFVSMIFNKVGVPSAGKFKNLKWNGQEYEKVGGAAKGQKKFINDNDQGHELSPEEEAKVLKPCVYKKR
jgi:ribosomal RNA-processing protein 8